MMMPILNSDDIDDDSLCIECLDVLFSNWPMSLSTGGSSLSAFGYTSKGGRVNKLSLELSEAMRAQLKSKVDTIIPVYNLHSSECTSLHLHYVS